jgi:hypothetical protein
MFFSDLKVGSKYAAQIKLALDVAEALSVVHIRKGGV